jgi:acetolactate synthase-1/2/3 large subunit
MPNFPFMFNRCHQLRLPPRIQITGRTIAREGVQLDHFFNALYDEGNAIRFIQNRHEQGDAYRALGYAAFTGNVGARTVVPGPQFLNASGALCITD